jgi:hypothetical protein
MQEEARARWFKETKDPISKQYGIDQIFTYDEIEPLQLRQRKLPTLQELLIQHKQTRSHTRQPKLVVVSAPREKRDPVAG